ncbi:single Ig IL-1-related receptor [Bufo gargarizans]|uniref:single Ig IL-1-related receptor n=1 Tax=Bufo gargarizans TaxID=30331 RepID=UPI001CF1B36A|nr:single Ig IL-1-related receptor [Bufo gargarizans]XP_044125754.1 single Ig IL-1-related receptor [Bufo gargarizans]XP_044125755.1 single Ig IL-1-related receptor [Bufo gargarizans]XP_044125757.1 single Ig IL-1-related receptor [Bufo gargarizans]XP_044125758.1 single Ig IL-1-related receptor [Bufo gargarizans]XP_044125759.1 single Ig IL-1-related receptor [Bufo gargarizans]
MTGAQCGFPLTLISPSTTDQELWPHLSTTVSLNCTLQVPGSCNGSVTWLKDGKAAEHPYTAQDIVWNGLNSSVKFLSSVLDVNLATEEDYGKFTCHLQNVSASFTLHKTDKAGHIAAVIFALCVVAVLVIGVVLYLKCRLNINLWYRDKYGEPEMNDGRLFDACVSFCPSNIDTKFTNFILKPQLENRYGYKLHLDERSLLASTEPSAELLMNVSRSRRLIVVLSMAYLEQEWCQNNFRDGFFRLLELSQTPIFILFENQYKDLPVEVIQLLNSQKGSLKMLMWKTDSVSPASEFWKELRLALPRKISLSAGQGDPQTQSQDDKDPMLTVNSEAADLDPDGDLGVRRSFYKAPPPRIAPVARVPDREPVGEVDISDLGSRNYAARSDYYCLVTEPDL